MVSGPVRLKPGRFEELSTRFWPLAFPKTSFAARLDRFREVVGRAVEAVRAGLDAHAGDAALGVAELGVEGRRLDPELLDHVGGRDVGRDDLVGVRRGGARRAVDQEVAAVAAGALVGVPDDVRRLVRPIQPLRARVGQAGREPHDLVGIAVDQRQLREAPLIHRESHVRIRGVEHGAIGSDADDLLHAPDLERNRQIASLVDLDHDVALDVLLEARELDHDLVGPGEQVVGLEQSLVVGRRRERRASGHVRDVHGRPGHNRLARIHDSAGDSPTCFLGAQGRREQETHQEENHRAVHVSGRGTFRFHCHLPSAVGAQAVSMPAILHGVPWRPRVTSSGDTRSQTALLQRSGVPARRSENLDRPTALTLAWSIAEGCRAPKGYRRLRTVRPSTSRGRRPSDRRSTVPCFPSGGGRC